MTACFTLLLSAKLGSATGHPCNLLYQLQARSKPTFLIAGLPRDKALQLAAQTLAGAAAMVLHSAGDGSATHPGVLKDRVASPAGTTIAGLNVLESTGVRGALMNAVKAAASRSAELSKQ